MASVSKGPLDHISPAGLVEESAVRCGQNEIVPSLVVLTSKVKDYRSHSSLGKHLSRNKNLLCIWSVYQGTKHLVHPGPAEIPQQSSQPVGHGSDVCIMPQTSTHAYARYARLGRIKLPGMKVKDTRKLGYVVKI